MPMEPTLRVIGTVRSRLSRLEDCPKSGDEGAPDAWLDIKPAYTPALESLEIGQTMTLITWLHLADREALAVHPRGDTSRPERGVFNTRSPARPNPLGIHEVELKAINPAPDGSKRLLVGPLEALHGTYIIDIKTSRAQRAGEKEAEVATPSQITARDAEIIRSTCQSAWSRGLLSGFNGNVSLRVGAHCLVTCTGAAKGSLQSSDLALVEMPSGKSIAGGKASSELAMHLEIYKNQLRAQAIVHTHPPKLLALGLRLPKEERLTIPVFEAYAILSRLAYVPDFAPGTDELAKAIGEAAKDHEAIWMERHGLVCWGENARKALALSEELEHLAGVHLQGLG